MQRFQAHRRPVQSGAPLWKQLLYSKSAIAVLLLVVVALGHGVWKMYKTERESYEKRVEAEEQRDELAERSARTEEAVAWVGTNDGQEYVLRTKYAVRREGEDLYVVVDKKDEEEVVPVTEEDSWWDRFLNLFGRGVDE